MNGRGCPLEELYEGRKEGSKSMHQYSLVLLAFVGSLLNGQN